MLQMLGAAAGIPAISVRGAGDLLGSERRAVAHRVRAEARVVDPPGRVPGAVVVDGDVVVTTREAPENAVVRLRTAP